MQTVCDFLKKAGTYYLATTEGNLPRVRPFGTAHIFENKLYIQTGKSKEVYMQVVANPNVEICAMVGGEWMRLTGRLAEDDRVEARKSMLDAYPALRSMYDEHDANTVVLYFEQGTATFYSFSAAPRTVVLR